MYFNVFFRDFTRRYPNLSFYLVVICLPLLVLGGVALLALGVAVVFDFIPGGTK